MVFVRTDNGCLICISHKLNEDGYLRKAWGTAAGRVAEMFHRFIYRAHKGEIPEGHEVDHLCRVRACCEPEHLAAIPGADHATKSNRQRYASRLAKARTLWESTGCSAPHLAHTFEVTDSCAYRWIREWGGGIGRTA